MRKQNEKIRDQFLIEFGKNVRRIRREKKLTQMDLAMRINGDSNKISRIERGEYNFKISSLLVVAQALDIEVIELFKIKNLDYLKHNILEEIDDFSLQN